MKIHSDNAPEFRGHVSTQLKEMLSIKGTFTMPYRSQSNGLCESINQTTENIIKCTVREKRNTWDKSLDLVMMAYRATPQTSTGFTSNMLVTSKENNIPCNLILAPRKPEYTSVIMIVIVLTLRNSEIQWLMLISKPGNVWEMLPSGRRFIMTEIQPHVILRRDWVIYWHKTTAMQTLSSSWTGPFIVTEKVSIVDYRI